MSYGFLCISFQKYWNWKKCFVVFLWGHALVPGQYYTWASWEDRLFWTPFIWHLAAAASCALLGISSIRVFGTLSCSPIHFLTVLYTCHRMCLSLVPCHFTLWVSPMLIRPNKEYFFQVDIEESTRAQALTAVIFILSFLFLHTMEKNFKEIWSPSYTFMLSVNFFYPIKGCNSWCIVNIDALK